MSDEAVCRTAPATPGLLKIYKMKFCKGPPPPKVVGKFPDCRTFQQFRRGGVSKSTTRTEPVLDDKAANEMALNDRVSNEIILDNRTKDVT